MPDLFFIRASSPLPVPPTWRTFSVGPYPTGTTRQWYAVEKVEKVDREDSGTRVHMAWETEGEAETAWEQGWEKRRSES